MTKNLDDACSLMGLVIPNIVNAFNAKNAGQFTMKVGQVLRTTEEQQALYAKGRTVPPIGDKYEVTQRDGVTRLSNHQAQWRHFEFASHAVDTTIFDAAGNYVTVDGPYRQLIALALAFGIKSGGDWNRNGIAADRDGDYRPDFPHLECLGDEAENIR